ncbi:DinB family protein [Peribacillus deserti]|uniref:Damage-inducible protein DinB n=1 Tax=Peribacillus deserti TaxID=673318 RepID=A0A2N5M2Q7_9BACI|nr:DinB family protein [Peribacillus deserti]PLT28656.1 damage-inducible protein DinB [Peribacillus deserti]
MDVLVSQYDWIQRTRESILGYCESLSPAEYVKELDSFGGDSILSLQVHVANCYQIWLGERALGKTLPEVTTEIVNDIQAMRGVFSKTDDLVHAFLNEFKGRWDQNIQLTLKSGHTMEPTALWLITHTVTHEFHHKGQIVKIGRQLGYVPPDTDLIEP